jgi:transcriptional regulator with XRE-family HTH domain
MSNTSSHRQHRTLVAIGDAVRRLRRERGISQEGLALLAEIDRSYLGRVERGDNNAAILTLQKIADALEITMTEIMMEAEL